MDPMEALLEKLSKYNGSLLSSQWKVPTTKKQFVNCVKRSIKLYYAIQNRNLTHPLLVLKLREIAAFFKMYITTELPEAANYLSILEEMETFEAPHAYQRIEFHRVEEPKRCSICKVDLVKPCYCIYITNEGMELKSEPIGIFCLQSLYGKLDKFVDSMRLTWEVDVTVKGIEENARQLLLTELGSKDRLTHDKAS